MEQFGFYETTGIVKKVRSHGTIFVKKEVIVQYIYEGIEYENGMYCKGACPVAGQEIKILIRKGNPLDIREGE